jgi:hypothetical protein
MNPSGSFQTVHHVFPAVHHILLVPSRLTADFKDMTFIGDELPWDLVRQTLSLPGRRLEQPVREFFERHLRRDLGPVRVHVDRHAAASAAALGVPAYAVGAHVVFAEGRYQPWTTAGRGLLAHELIHAVQQDLEVRIPSGPIPCGAPGDAFELEAEACAHNIAHAPFGSLAVVLRSDGPRLQGWFTQQDIDSGWVAQHGMFKINRTGQVQGQTHQFLTQFILAKNSKFNPIVRNGEKFPINKVCKQYLINGSSLSDQWKKGKEEARVAQLVGKSKDPAVIEKAKEQAHNEIGALYHGFGSGTTSPVYAGIKAASDTYDRKTREYVLYAIDLVNNRKAELPYCLETILGQALHAAQDKGAHNCIIDPCQLCKDELKYCVGKYANEKPEHWAHLDIPSINPTGWNAAFANTLKVLSEFFDGLTRSSLLWIQTNDKDSVRVA